MICRFLTALPVLLGCAFGLTVPLGWSSGVAADEIRLHLSYLPQRLTETSGRQYDRLIEEVFEGTEIEVTRLMAPLKRTTALFKADPGSCVFPANIVALNMGDRASEVFALETVDVVSIRLYTTTANRAGSGLTDFEPERVGYIRGSGAIHLLGPDADRFLAINSEEQLITMLELGRLDAFVGHHPDTALALDKLGKPDALHASPEAFLDLRFPVSFICHDNRTGHLFRKAVNPRIKALHDSGRLQAILGPHAELPRSEEVGDTVN